MKRFIISLTLTFTLTLTVLNIVSAQNIIRPKIACPNDVWVNSYTGLLFYERIDASIPNRQMPLEAHFYYNSYDCDKNYGYGNGWSLGYEYRYSIKNDTITITQGDGRYDDYVLEGGTYKAPAGVFNKVTANANGITMVTPEGTVYGFRDTVSKRVTSITDRNHNYIGLTYTDGHITRIYDRRGRSLLLEYYADGMLARLKVEGTDRQWTYLYDENHNLISVTSPMSHTSHYGYDGENRINRFTDAAGHSTWVTYNDNGQAHRIRTELSDMSIRYELASNQTVIVDYLNNGNNQFSTYRWDDRGRVIEKSGNCCGMTSRLTYDDDDNIVSSEDANGNITTYTYDNRGNILTMTDPLGYTETYTWHTQYNIPTSYTDKGGNHYTYTYDTVGNLTAINGPLGYWRHYEYNAFGQRTRTTGPMGYQTSTTYDTYGNIATSTDARGNTTTYTYDLLGNCLSKITPGGVRYNYAYNPENYPVSEAITTANGLPVRSRSFAYDVTNRMISMGEEGATQQFIHDALGRLAVHRNANGDTTFYTYNAKDKVTAVRDVLGGITRYSYDDRDRMTSMTDPLGNRTSYSYDAVGLPTATGLPGGRLKEYVYDALGQPIQASDNNGVQYKITYNALGLPLQVLKVRTKVGNTYTYDTVSFTYDALGRLTQKSHGSGESIHYTYDSLSRTTSFTDAAGHTTTYAYDAVGNVVLQINTMNGTTMMTYDADNRLSTVTDALGNTTTYTYDEGGRVSQVLYPDGRNEQYSYDMRGNVATFNDKAGNTQRYFHDANNNLTKVTYVSTGTIQNYTYNAKGNLLTVSDPNTTITRSYDLLGRLLSESTVYGTQPARTTTYSYNDSARIANITYPSGRMVEYIYNIGGKLANVRSKASASSPFATVAHYSRRADNMVETLTYGNGITTNYNNDHKGRVNSIVAAATSDLPGWSILLQSQHFTYDPLGNILSSIDSVNLPFSNSYQYDNLGRLVGTEMENYTYDALGNRLTSTVGDQTTDYTANSVNGYTAVGGQTLTYDNNGNLTGDGTFSYSYDNDGRLVATTMFSVSSSPFSVLYTYDPLGRRIRKTVGDTVTDYAYAKDQMIEATVSLSSTGNILSTTSYVYSSTVDDVIAAFRGSEVYYYHKDRLGSTVAVSNGSGQTVEQYSYDAFGTPHFYSTTGSQRIASAIGNDILFAGREYDKETGLYHYRARTYNPTLGRFMQQDPTVYDDGLNMYAYVGNNPTNYIDPSGLRRKDCQSSGKGGSGSGGSGGPDGHGSSGGPDDPDDEGKWGLDAKSTIKACVVAIGGFCTDVTIGIGASDYVLHTPFGDIPLPNPYIEIGSTKAIGMEASIGISNSVGYTKQTISDELFETSTSEELSISAGPVGFSKSGENLTDMFLHGGVSGSGEIPGGSGISVSGGLNYGRDGVTASGGVGTGLGVGHYGERSSVRVNIGTAIARLFE